MSMVVPTKHNIRAQFHQIVPVELQVLAEVDFRLEEQAQATESDEGHENFVRKQLVPYRKGQEELYLYCN